MKQFYDENSVKQSELNQRLNSNIVTLRNFNNWVKSVLIQVFLRIPYGAEVLDMACGKGGDLRKWGESRIGHLVCVGNGSIVVVCFFVCFFVFLFFCFLFFVFCLFVCLLIYLDLSDASIEKCNERFQKFNLNYSADFYVADCTRVRLLTNQN